MNLDFVPTKRGGGVKIDGDERTLNLVEPPLISASTALLLVAVIEAAASSASPAWKIGAAIPSVINMLSKTTLICLSNSTLGTETTNRKSNENYTSSHTRS